MLLFSQRCLHNCHFIPSWNTKTEKVTWALFGDVYEDEPCDKAFGFLCLAPWWLCSLSITHEHPYLNWSATCLSWVTRLLRQMTGHREHPRVQQQHTQPQRSHLKLRGIVRRSTSFTSLTVCLNSSWANLACSAWGNSVSNLLLNPNLKAKRCLFLTTIRLEEWKTCYIVTDPVPLMITGWGVGASITDSLSLSTSCSATSSSMSNTRSSVAVAISMCTLANIHAKLPSHHTSHAMPGKRSKISSGNQAKNGTRERKRGTSCQSACWVWWSRELGTTLTWNETGYSEHVNQQFREIEERGGAPG